MITYQKFILITTFCFLMGNVYAMQEPPRLSNSAIDYDIGCRVQEGLAKYVAAIKNTESLIATVGDNAAILYGAYLHKQKLEHQNLRHAYHIFQEERWNGATLDNAFAALEGPATGIPFAFMWRLRETIFHQRPKALYVSSFSVKITADR